MYDLEWLSVTHTKKYQIYFYVLFIYVFFMYTNIHCCQWSKPAVLFIKHFHGHKMETSFLKLVGVFSPELRAVHWWSDYLELMLIAGLNGP